jgi:hypothetical protein
MGYVEGKNLFTTQDDEWGGLDIRTIETTPQKIRALL